MQKTTIIGRLGQDAETITTKDNKTFYKASVAVNLSKDNTRWYNVIFPERMKGLAPYLVKGQQVYIEGTDSLYTNKEGVASFNLSANVVQLIGKVESQEQPKQQAKEQPRPIENVDDLPF